MVTVLRFSVGVNVDGFLFCEEGHRKDNFEFTWEQGLLNDIHVVFL